MNCCVVVSPHQNWRNVSYFILILEVCLSVKKRKRNCILFFSERICVHKTNSPRIEWEEQKGFPFVIFFIFLCNMSFFSFFLWYLRIRSVSFSIHSREIFALFNHQFQATRMEVIDEAKFDLTLHIDGSVSTSVCWVHTGHWFWTRLKK